MILMRISMLMMMKKKMMMCLSQTVKSRSKSLEKLLHLLLRRSMSMTMISTMKKKLKKTSILFQLIRIISLQQNQQLSQHKLQLITISQLRNPRVTSTMDSTLTMMKKNKMNQNQYNRIIRKLNKRRCLRNL